VETLIRIRNFREIKVPSRLKNSNSQEGKTLCVYHVFIQAFAVLVFDLGEYEMSYTENWKFLFIFLRYSFFTSRNSFLFLPSVIVIYIFLTFSNKSDNEKNLLLFGAPMNYVGVLWKKHPPQYEFSM